MAFTEKDFQAQQTRLSELKDELSRLNAEFEAQKKALGVTDAELAEEVDPATLPPEVRQALAEAEEQARRAGEARRTQAALASAPSGSVQMMFAKLQLAQGQICKNQAEDYMKQVEDIQDEQKKCADMISRARELQQKARQEGEDAATEMPADMREFFTKRGLDWDDTGNNYTHNADEWDYNLKSLTNYQEQIGNKTQTLMVYLQDFIGQYNSFTQGANTSIANANQTLTNIARGQ